MTVKVYLYRDDRVNVSITVEKDSYAIVRSEPGSDDLIRISKKDRATLAKILGDIAAGSKRDDAEEVASDHFLRSKGAGDDVSVDEDILSAASLAFKDAPSDPFDNIERILKDAGLGLELSTWSNL